MTGGVLAPRVLGRGLDSGPARAVLVIEDDLDIAQMVSVALTRESLITMIAGDGEAGLECFRAAHPALVLLDLTLPGMSGHDVCRQLRGESDVPIVAVSSRDSEADRIHALETGADDYLAKPFSIRELMVRIRVHLRRAGPRRAPVDDTVLQRGPVRLDASKHEVHVRGERVAFTPKEFKLLETLMVADGRLRTRGSLIDRVWGTTYFGDTKTLDVHVKRLRAKIELDPRRPEHIVTVRGLGYRFLEEPVAINA